MASAVASPPASLPSSSSNALHQSHPELPKRKRARTRKRKSGGTTTDPDDAKGRDEDDGKVSGTASAARGEADLPSPTWKGKERAEAATTTESEPAESGKSSEVLPFASEHPAGSASAGDIEGEDSDDDDSTRGNASGRKRKRSRKRNKKGPPQAQQEADPMGSPSKIEQSTQSRLPPPSMTSTPAESELRKELDQIPDPEQDESLSQGAKNALFYAYTFHNSRQSWKFQKAKEAWLLRHILDHPLPKTGSEPASAAITPAEPQQRTDTFSAAPKEMEESHEETDNSIPETYIALVGHYLSTMQGGSKDRLREQLRRAVAEGETIPAEESLPEATNLHEASEKPDSVGHVSPTKVGVRFADLADQTNHEALGADDVEKSRRDHIRWRGARAQRILNYLGAQ